MASKNAFYKLKGLEIKELSKRKSLFLIATATILLYANTFTHDFAFDDIAVITKNSFVQEGINGIDDILTTGSWDGFNPSSNMKIYRPFQLVIFAIQYEGCQLNPIPYHIVQVLFYGLLNCLLFLLFKQFWKNKYPYLPLLIVLIFAAHPVHVDVVANIKGSADLFGMLNAIVAFLFLFYYIKTKKTFFILSAALFYLLSLLSKEIAVTYIGVYPIAMFYFTKLKIRQIVKLTIPFIGVIVLYLGIRALVFQGTNAMAMSLNKISNSILFAESMSQEIGMRLYGLGKNLQLLFFPHPLQSTYVHAEVPIIEMYDFLAVSTLLIYLFMIGLCIYYFRKKSILIFGISYYLLTISLFSNTYAMMPSILSERWLLLPSLGFCIVLATVIYKSANGMTGPIELIKKNRVVILITVSILFLFSFKTIDRNFDWKNDITLFAADIKTAPNNHFTLRAYGSELIKTNDSINIRKGIGFLKKSLEIAPKRYGTNNNIGVAYKKLSDYKNAAKAFERELLLAPNNQKVKSQLWNCYNNLGIQLMETNNKAKIEESISYFKKAQKLLPENYQAIHNLGKAYYLLGDFKNAIKVYETIYKANPKKYDSVYALGLIYNKEKRYNEALAVLLTLKNIEGYKNTSSLNKQLYIAYAGLGDINEANKFRN